MKIGVGFPYHSIGSDPEVYRSYAKRAEELGFAHMTFVDHVLGPVHTHREPPLEGPYTEESVFHEPLTLMSWLAGQTKRLVLFSAILILPQRQAVLVAKQAAEIQLLSQGRLRLGLGTGWNYVEYESLGVPYAQRGRRLEEQIEVMRKLWTEGVLDYTGEFHRIDRASQLPRPDVTVPIWFGGYSGAALDRCARLGDGFTFMRLTRLSVAAIGIIRQRAAELGRNPDALGFDTILNQSWPIPADGSTSELVQSALRWRSAGGTHATIHVEGEGAELLTNLERTARDLGDLLTDS